ncbi:hypothetical protein [Aliiroseovarius sediminis]|uniref:hypothetical protein n=1 Tax=Aliiroseovarius sediminis TaxID=2925839 RepID=UPI001F55FF68|nr:hypothetical protein [Aliiroseovarius sediminis]MCI2395537.1 hypothetical protein [Aliiroseovarius sediminis]
MGRDTIIPALIAALVLVAIAAGLTITGGPISARAERRDLARLDDLRTLKTLITCQHQVNGALPDTLFVDTNCAYSPLGTDPLTNAPYGYEKLSDTSYRLCASFERPDLIRDHDLGPGTWQPDSGCFILTQP